jgi:hypothetical protein
MNKCCSLVLCSAGLALVASANPYENIGTRNIFSLVPPKADISKPGDVFKPPPEYKLTGIAGFGSNKWALLSKADPGKAPQLFMMREGERDGTLEVLHVDELGGIVKIRNDGALVDLTFATNAAPKIDVATKRFVDQHTQAHELHQRREAERIARERAEFEQAEAQRAALDADRKIIEAQAAAQAAESQVNPEQQ